MEVRSEYLFFFVGGTSGSFVKTIFSYYINKLSQDHVPVILDIDPDTGHCHFTYHALSHTHYLHMIDPDKKLIAIDFDEDDKKIIANMVFHKIFWPNMFKDPKITNKFKTLKHIDLTDYQALKKYIIDNPDFLIFEDWKQQLAKVRPALIIQFKEIMFGNLNQIIANFFRTTPLPEIDEFINKYRDINKRYLDVA